MYHSKGERTTTKAEQTMTRAPSLPYEIQENVAVFESNIYGQVTESGVGPSTSNDFGVGVVWRWRREYKSFHDNGFQPLA